MSASPMTPPVENVERWPTERPLFAVCVVVSVVVWVVLLVSIIGAMYVLFFAAFFFTLHVLFVSYVRGSAVRLGPDQFPELHARVEQLSRQLGLARPPEAYLMQAGGALNAFATRFLRSNMIVLYTDLLDACGDNQSARDMIIAHELGHLAAGHLRFRWLIMPAGFIPFLTLALSRAREYTCDRFGLVGAGDRDGAVLGLTVLAAGGKLAPKVNRVAFARQRDLLATGWMTIGEWLSTHPPLSRRITAIDESLATAAGPVKTGAPRALGIIGAVLAVSVGGGVWGARAVRSLMEQAGVSMASQSSGAASDVDSLTAQVLADFDRLGQLIEAHMAATGRPPSEEELEELWTEAYPDEAMPLDPFDGFSYGYEIRGTDYRLWSSGPDGEPETDDDIARSAPARLRRSPTS